MKALKILRSFKPHARFAVAIMLFGLLAGTALLQAVIAANTSQLYLSPSSASVKEGSNLTVSVRVKPNGNVINGVEAYLNYDKDKLQYSSMSASGTAFDVALGPQSGGNGSVTIVRGTLGSVSADSLVAKVTFKATATGSASVSFTSGSNVTKSDGTGYAPLNRASGTYTVTAQSNSSPPTEPNTPATPKPSNKNTADDTNNAAGSSNQGSDDNASKPATSTTTEPTRSGLKVTAVEPVNIGLTRAVIRTELNRDATVTVRFGTDENLRYSGERVKSKNKKADVALNEQYLLPGTTYSYQVVAVDSSGDETASEVKQLKTKGFTVTVMLRDKNDQPIKNTEVTLYSEPMTAKSNGDGQVEFSDVALGEHELELQHGGETYRQKLVVLDTSKDEEQQVDGGLVLAQTATPQTFVLQFAEVQVNNRSQVLVLAAVVVAVLALVSIGIKLLQKRRRGNGPTNLGITGSGQSNNGPSSSTPSATPGQPAPPNEVITDRPNRVITGDGFKH